MTHKYFTIDDVPFVFDPKIHKIFMLIGDNWVEIEGADIKEKVRFHSVEISEEKAMMLARKQLLSGNVDQCMNETACE